MEFHASKPFDGVEVPDKQEFHRFLSVENEKIPGGVVLAFLEEIIHHRMYSNSKEVHKKLNSLDHNLILDLHNYALKLLAKIYDNSDLRSWRELVKNPNFLEYCIVLGNTNYYKKMNAATSLNKLQIMSEILDITIKYKNSENIQQLTTFNEGKNLVLYVLEHRNKIYFLFPNRHDLGIWRTQKKPKEEEKLTVCTICDLEYPLKLFQHKICKCEICDICISKFDSSKCPKCKKSVKSDTVKKFKTEISNNLCAGCLLKIPCNVEKVCDCKLCMDCIRENPTCCKRCNTENYLVDKAYQEDLHKKHVICEFLKSKLAEVTEFEDKVMLEIQDMYRIIEKSKNHYLKEIEAIKKIISDNLHCLADVTLIKCLSLSTEDLEYSIGQAVILSLTTSFEMKHLEEFFDSNFKAGFGIEVPVCFKCHQHLFIKPIKLIIPII